MAKYPANLAFLEEMLVATRSKAFAKGWKKEEATLLEVAVEEAVVNIIQHGYKDSEGEIELHFLDTPNMMIGLEIKDKGPPFDPSLLKGEYNPELSLEDREIGGNGLLLMKRILDKVSYRREEPFNVLYLEKSPKRA
ncbi:MAG: ATP-binding protein [Chlamydiia bacterium]|nr:ATP-binding protein [Chlamydiia bacterium]